MGLLGKKKASASRQNKNKLFEKSLKVLLGYKPSNIALYYLAFRHRSAAQMVNGCPSSNERLEYLGDAVLGTIIAEYLFRKFPFKDEGFLTEMRSRIVSRNSLNKLSFKLGLEELIECGSSSSRIGRSACGDTFEALIGAVYLDKGYKKTRRFVIQNILNNHFDIEEIEKQEINFKSKLIEWAQKHHAQLRFVVINQTENQRGRLYEIELFVNNTAVSRAKDYSKKKAEQTAAELACKTLIEDTESE